MVSMRNHWPDVKRVFEALSYIVKPMFPDGTELFFTVSYDTWRRKDTSDLCAHLEKREVAGLTKISYRLNLQLQSYKAKLQSAPRKAGKMKHVRQMSFYILTNGDWSGGGADPKTVISDIAEYLVGADLRNAQVTIEFISFAKNAATLQRINDLAKVDFGLDIVDCTPWTGNVLKMLLGPYDKSLFQESGSQLSMPGNVSASVPSAISELA